MITKSVSGTFRTEIYRKATGTNLYINWKSFAPKNWKIGTLKGLFRRAYLVCSDEEGLEKELKHLKYVFTKINNYPSKIYHNSLESVKKAIEKESQIQALNSTVNETNDQTKEIYFPSICLPYKGKEGEGILNNFKGYLKHYLPQEVKPQVSYKGKKLGSLFKVKDQIKKEHQSSLIYGFREQVSHIGETNIDYIGETHVRYGTRTREHTITDKNSAIFKHAKHFNVEINDSNFKILEKGYSKTVDRKIAEALYIKEHKPKLNEQVKSFKLHLFN